MTSHDGAADSGRRAPTDTASFDTATTDPGPIDDDELRRFAATFSRFIENVHRIRPPGGGQLRPRRRASRCRPGRPGAGRPGHTAGRATKPALPGGGERRRLLDLYLAGTSHQLTNLDSVVEQTDGVTASFMKELVRRAVLVVLERATAGLDVDRAKAADGPDADDSVVITDADLEAALDELLSSTSAVSQSLFGLGSGALGGTTT